jgi:hypothetical protein
VATEQQRDRRRPNRIRRPKMIVKQMTDAEAAWVGAFIDAEGWVSLRDGCWNILVGNTEVEHISALLRATGTGGVISRIPPASNLGHKRMYLWSILQDAAARELARQIAPYSLKAQKVLK